MPHILHVGFSEAFSGAIDFERHTATLLLHRYRAERVPEHVLARFARVAVFDTDDPSDIGGYEKQLDTIVKLADELADEFGPPQAVVGLFEHTVYPAAVLRDHFGVPGTGSQVALRCRDKVEMKRALRGGKVAVPRFWPIEQSTTAEQLEELLVDVPGRVVLKPRGQAGSVGVIAFGSVEELLDHAATVGFEDGYEVEEFVDGTVCHLDGVVRGGDVGFLSISRYVGTCLSFEAESVPVGSVSFDDPVIVARTAEFTAQVLGKLGLRDSSFHLEAFLTPSGSFVFLEIACRFGGAGVPTQLRLGAGFDIARETALACTGEPSEWTGPSTMVAASDRAWGMVWMPIPMRDSGWVRRIHGLDTCPDSVVSSEIPSIGTQLNPGAFYAAAGKFILAGPSTASVQADMEYLMSSYSVEMTDDPTEPPTESRTEPRSER